MAQRVLARFVLTQCQIASRVTCPPHLNKPEVDPCCEAEKVPLAHGRLQSAKKAEWCEAHRQTQQAAISSAHAVHTAHQKQYALPQKNYIIYMEKKNLRSVPFAAEFWLGRLDEKAQTPCLAQVPPVECKLVFLTHHPRQPHPCLKIA